MGQISDSRQKLGNKRLKKNMAEEIALQATVDKKREKLTNKYEKIWQTLANIADNW